MNKKKVIKGKHYAYYGEIKMVRAYCPDCQQNALVIRGKLACCDNYPKKKSNDFEVMCSTKKKRMRPSKTVKDRIFKIQGNKCLYCGVEYGTPYYYKKKERYTHINYDHLVPFSYTQSNPKNNWVGACNICNGIKSNKMFDTIEDVLHYVETRRKEKGYEYLNEKI